jgi:hypothetical protein
VDQGRPQESKDRATASGVVRIARATVILLVLQYSQQGTAAKNCSGLPTGSCGAIATKLVPHWLLVLVLYSFAAPAGSSAQGKFLCRGRNSAFSTNNEKSDDHRQVQEIIGSI